MLQQPLQQVNAYPRAKVCRGGFTWSKCWLTRFSTQGKRHPSDLQGVRCQLPILVSSQILGTVGCLCYRTAEWCILQQLVSAGDCNAPFQQQERQEQQQGQRQQQKNTSQRRQLLLWDK